MAYLKKEDQAASSKRHYQRNKQKVKARAAAFKRKAKKRNRIFVNSFLENKCCKHCGETDITVLEFDHIVKPKRGDICTLINQAVSLETLQFEINKCQILCANCHRRKTKGELRGSRV